MTHDSIRIKILDEYKVFPSNYIQIEWVNHYIEKYKIDPCNHKTITNAINKLKKEFEKIKSPEKHPLSENIITTPSGHKRRLKSKRDMNESKLYIGITNEEGNAIIRKAGDIEFAITILNRWLITTKVYLPDLRKPEDENHNNESKRNTKSMIKKFKNLYWENSRECKMDTAMRMAEVVNASKGSFRISSKTVNRYLNDPEILNELFDELEDRHNILLDKKNEAREDKEMNINSDIPIDEINKAYDNVSFNFNYINKRKTKLKNKATIKNHLVSKKKEKTT